MNYWGYFFQYRMRCIYKYRTKYITFQSFTLSIDSGERVQKTELSHGVTSSIWNQKIKFPYRGSLRHLTNTSQPLGFGANYIRPLQSMWENCQPILTGCDYAQRSYTWRHNEVPEIFAVASKISCETANKALNNIINRAIHFVKEGNISKLSRKSMYSSLLLDGCSEWHVAIDLEHHFVFPNEMALTTQRPDIVIWTVEF